MSSIPQKSRKFEHLDRAFEAQVHADSRPNWPDELAVDYEPLLAPHPDIEKEIAHPSQSFKFIGKSFHFPFWISSMTGGVGPARHINQNLARAAVEFGLGMGLGSCRPLLQDDQYFEDFNLRPILGDDRLFLANLGIAQVEQLLAAKEIERIHILVERLRADGLIIHVNPLQEFFQPEGDRFQRAPIHVLEEFLESAPYPVVVKEVGQGMGPRSLRALLKLPLAAIDFASFGGTNFTKLELNRGAHGPLSPYHDFAHVGHTAHEMVAMVKQIELEMGSPLGTEKQYIISGGIQSVLEGMPSLQALQGRSLLGMAQTFLHHAMGGYTELQNHVRSQVGAYLLARQYLHYSGPFISPVTGRPQ
ncbi:MAG: hypothetical protein A2X86_15170 [Bdellovibrionales bacterium GWA2_49_15]|nr:MAG: hypothetical protein A2X86_15170 [Bdellovibrionales bacterium GWA2_49_15]HAZ13314.1 type 2 isopentenyl-diphosphate Delta-isomerase [Bdellovibrionales bacterium]